MSGGSGSIYQALVYNVPLVCVYTNLDQEWNGNRIAQLKLGFSIKDEVATPQKINQIFNTLIGRKNLVMHWNKAIKSSEIRGMELVGKVINNFKMY